MANFRHRAVLQNLVLFVSLLLLAASAEATGRKALTPASVARLSPVKPPVLRSAAPVMLATRTGEGQAGYVHFFLIKYPDDTAETQIGIELPDQSIAWSFPGLGVMASPFIESGILHEDGKPYEVQHLYGIRPFPDEASMRVLQRELAGRIAPYIDHETPYCYLRSRTDPFCLSCLDFVARVLFPGHFPDFPNLPRDFERTTSSPQYSTEDLLLYFLGLHDLPTRAARFNRLEQLALPENLRADASRLIELMEPDDTAVAADAGRAPATAGKDRRGTKPSGKIDQQRPTRRRKS
jgi:hypothetical protein